MLAYASIQNALSRADRLLTEGRDRISHLRSETLDDLSLEQALVVLGAELNTDRSILFEVSSNETGFPLPLRPAMKDELFLIAREALTNAFRHANANRIRVSLECTRRHLKVVCQDDGVGLKSCIDDPKRLDSKYGVKGMRERASRLGGELEIRSEGSRGTTVTFEIAAELAYVRRPRWLRVRLPRDE